MSQDTCLVESPAEAFKVAMRSLAATVTLVTSGEEGRRSGLAVTATCSLCMEPPLMVVCVNQSSNTHARISETGHFAVNLLSSNDQHQHLAKVFSDSSLVGEDKFKHGEWASINGSAPMLEGTLASIDCEVASQHQMGTHTIFVGQVRHVLNSPTLPPLIYANRRFTSVTA
jgi:cob(II)yrinic acid a,c-diamide reductase